MIEFRNPIIKGFNPDPSIIRVGNDYYIATSTFEWFPGVQIHHSTDLANWQLVTQPLSRKSQLDMKGVPDSCGVWAPCLSYDKGTFYLVYSNTKSFKGTWKDTPNYLVTTDDIAGEWSEPVFMSARGFDGSIFHDQDGSKWYVSMIMDHRKGKFFGGIVLQKFDESNAKLVGKPYLIFEGSDLGITEGPHLYQKDGYYYLITAEGGTEYGHAVTIARSKDITGPYELHPQNPFLTARNDPKWPLQRTGHADMVEDENGNWFIVFLVGRPLTEHGRCTLGRESAIEEVVWRGGWPYLKHGDVRPRLTAGDPSPEETVTFKESFKGDLLPNWQSLRIPFDPSWIQQDQNKGLVLYGKESLSSLHTQALVARRVTHFDFEATTFFTFCPRNYQQMAGLVFYYNSSHYIYCHLSSDFEGSKNVVTIVVCDKDDFYEPLAEPHAVNQLCELGIRGRFVRDKIQFYLSVDGTSWTAIGPELDGSILSDDYVRDDEVKYQPAFTGTFVGLCCQDLSGENIPATFHSFETVGK